MVEPHRPLKRRRRQIYLRFIGLGLIGLLLLFSSIPLRLAIARYYAPDPQAILVLGGGPDRERLVAHLARFYPNLDIWVSSGSPPHYLIQLFQQNGVPLERVHLDYRAVDTVTNFTSLVDTFKQRQIHHLLLITSNYHMPRSTAIATIVLGSQGITFSPLQSYGGYQDESLLTTVRDVGRSLLWMLTGYTGVNLRQQ